MGKRIRKTEVGAAGFRTYFFVWIALIALLVVTIVVARLELTRYRVLINLLIASFKAGLVLAFFMHLREEGKFLKCMVFLSISALTSIIILTFADTWYRIGGK